MGENIWILVPIMGMSIPIFAIWMKHREQLERHRINAGPKQAAELPPQYQAQIKALEDRVRVLERIVTDGSYDVAAQIEALRDTRPVTDMNRGVPLGLASKETV